MNFARSAIRSKACMIAAAVLVPMAWAMPASGAQSGPAFTVQKIGTIAGSKGNFFSGNPLLARNASGAFVVVYFQTSNSVSHTLARLYNADATPKGAAFEIGSSLDVVSSVAMAPSGAFAVASLSAGANPSSHAQIQRYAADGTPQGPVIDAGPAPVVYGTRNIVISTAPSLAMDRTGNMAVAWSTQINQYQTGTTAYSQSSATYAAIYAADGSTLQPNTVVDSVPVKTINPAAGTGYNNHMLEGLAMDGDGDLAMVFGIGWDEQNIATQMGVELFDRQLGSKGSMQVVPEVQEFAAIGMDGVGNYALAWRNPADGTANVARFDAAGAPLGAIGPLGAPVTAPSAVETPTLSMTPTGAFAVTWGVQVPSSVSGFTTEEKHAQYFNANGSPNGGEFVIDASPGRVNSAYSASAITARGKLVTVWHVYLENAAGTSLTGEAIVGRQSAP